MNDETLKEQILTEFKQVHKLAPADYTENCTNVVMSIIKGDRERAVREARVDELKSIALVCWDLEDGEDPNDAVAIEVEHRIADLQSTIKTNRSI